MNTSSKVLPSAHNVVHITPSNINQGQSLHIVEKSYGLKYWGKWASVLNF